MKYEKLALEQYRDLRKEFKCIYQAWDKTKAIGLKYVGGEETARATVADYDGMTIRYAGAGPGTIKIEENKVTISGNSVPTEYDLTAAAYDTIGELVAVIHALADWTCTKGADIATGVASKHLKILLETDCKTGDLTCAMDRALFVEAPNGTADTDVGVDGKIFLRDTAKDTLTELVAFLNGLADYECTLGDQYEGSEASSGLSTLVATSILTTLWFATDTQLQIKIILPSTPAKKTAKVTKIIGKSTYGSGASALYIYKDTVQKWLEDGGATNTEKTSVMPVMSSLPGEQIIVKIVNSVAMTAGYLCVAYEEKDGIALF